MSNDGVVIGSFTDLVRAELAPLRAAIMQRSIELALGYPLSEAVCGACGLRYDSLEVASINGLIPMGRSRDGRIWCLCRACHDAIYQAKWPHVGEARDIAVSVERGQKARKMDATDALRATDYPARLLSMLKAAGRQDGWESFCMDIHHSTPPPFYSFVDDFRECLVESKPGQHAAYLGRPWRVSFIGTPAQCNNLLTLCREYLLPCTSEVRDHGLLVTFLPIGDPTQQVE